jgi:hypothetical protein
MAFAFFVMAQNILHRGAKEKNGNRIRVMPRLHDGVERCNSGIGVWRADVQGKGNGSRVPRLHDGVEHVQGNDV